MSAPEARRGLARGFSADRASLVTYLMAGYPDRATSLASLRAAAGAGADVIELGVPYGDPLADGPVIVGAGHAARAAAEDGFGLAEAIALAAEFIAAASDLPPVALMTYLNPVLRYGFDRAAEDMAAAGIGGVIIPDLPPDGRFAAAWTEAAAAHGVDTVFLAAPTSTPERLAQVVAASTGFIYCVSSLGVTGERTEVASGLGALVERIREARDRFGDPETPVAVGFGVGTAAQAAAVGAVADGVVVGSAIVRRQVDPDEVGRFVAELAGALRSGDVTG